MAAPVIDWLLREGRLSADPVRLIDALAARLLAAGAPVWRLRLAFFTLHPQLAVWAYVWMRGRATRIEPIAHGVQRTAAFIGSPAERMLATDAPVRYRLERLAAADHRLLHDLAAEGGVDYVMLPLRFSDGSRNVFAVTTDRAGGFRARDLAQFERLSHALAAVLEVAATRRLARTLLDTYVGRRSGRRILEGQIRRGASDVIQAAIWYADLRDFTALTESLPTAQLLETLNAYFETIGAAVSAHGGEILRFIGDAMLIVFPAAGKRTLEDASRAALDAALDAFERMKRLNRERRAAGKPRIRFGAGLSAGEVIYGNVGAPDRLDFTVMGLAVNRAARIEGLTKKLGVALLMSAEVAERVRRRLKSAGRHRLRGLRGPVEVYALRDCGSCLTPPRFCQAAAAPPPRTAASFASASASASSERMPGSVTARRSLPSGPASTHS
jgi:adenylate cyclase